MLQHVPFITRNALRNRRRSLLTILSIGVSLCLLGVLLSLYLGLFHAPDSSPAQALRAITRHKVSLTQSLPIAYRREIEKVPGVKAVTYWQWYGGTYIKPENFFARFGIDPQTLFDVFPDMEIAPEQVEAFKKSRTACVAGEALAKKYGWKLGERITLIGDIFPGTLDLTLVGTFHDENESQTLFLNYEYVREGFPAGNPRRDMVGCFMFTVNKPEDVAIVSKAIDEQFANSPSPTRSESEKEFALQFIAFLGNLKLFLAAISAAVVFTILLVSANTVAMAVRERTRENAILRTVGFTPGQIMGMVLGEAGVLGLIGGILGGLAASALCKGLTVAARQTGMGLSVAVPGIMLWSILLSVAVLIAVLSALAPAWFASRRPVVEAVRYNG
jgi:putative ABC transport system permease protein